VIAADILGTRGLHDGRRSPARRTCAVLRHETGYALYAAAAASVEAPIRGTEDLVWILRLNNFWIRSLCQRQNVDSKGYVYYFANKLPTKSRR
jgi:hypothetical protein